MGRALAKCLLSVVKDKDKDKITYEAPSNITFQYVAEPVAIKSGVPVRRTGLNVCLYLRQK